MSTLSPKGIRRSEKYPDWQNLPIELTEAIANRDTSIGDYVSFRAVSSSWRSAATFANFDREYPRVPWLMYAAEEEKEEKTVLGDVDGKFTALVTNFPDLQGNNVRKFKFFDLQSKTSKIIYLPTPAGTPYLSWSGWILYNGDGDVKLIHFLWPAPIDLPDLKTFTGRLSTIQKMVLSDSPTIKSDLVVMVIWGGRNQLGFCRPGDACWTATDHWKDSFCDIVYSNKKLYAVDSSLRIVQCDVHGNNPTQLLRVFDLGDIDHNLRSRSVTHYLVESSGKLLIVCRRVIQRKTKGFQVFEIDLMDGSHKVITELGNRALFLGCNASICVKLSDESKVERDCIYFTGNIWPFDVSDMGVYKLANGSIEGIEGFLPESGLISPPPTWVLPSF